MSDYDVDAIQEAAEVESNPEDVLPDVNVPEPVVIRGCGNVTVYVYFRLSFIADKRS
jgi:hypothetical protein